MPDIVNVEPDNRGDCKDIGRGVTFDDRSPSISNAHTTTNTSSPLERVCRTQHTAKWPAAGARRRPTHLSWHISVSCLGSTERGIERTQNWHDAGSSEMAFSTARLRLQSVRLISHRHPGQVGVSSLRRASASRCDRQLAHIRCPFVHCNVHTHSKTICH